MNIDDKPLLTVLCYTYNHEQFISRAIESILMQETKFKFKVVVHDDASTDKTVDILKKFQSENPSVIELILQTENKYTISKTLPFQISLNYVEGQYLAICEGDDYWLSASKLQKQVDIIEANNDISMVFSSAIQKSKGKKDFIRNDHGGDGILPYDLRWVLSNGGGFYPTASMLFRSSVVSNPPRWLFEHTTGDYPLAILCVLHGKLYFQSQPQSVYVSHDESVSHRLLDGDGFQSLERTLLDYNQDMKFIDLLVESNIITDTDMKILSGKIVYKFHRQLAKNGMLVFGGRGLAMALLERAKVILHFILSKITNR